MAGTFAEKWARLESAINLKEPDRVPFAPKIALYYCYNYGVSVYDVMKDFRNAEPAIRSFIKDFDPDLVWAPPVYPIDPLDALGSTMIHWPGPDHKLPLTSSFQHLDGTYMEDDEFEEFITDPTHFLMTKVLPRKHKNLKGLEKINLREVYDMSFVMDLAPFATPEVVSALMTLMHAGKHVQDKIQQAKYIDNVIVNDCNSVFGCFGS